jgi:hypothetical protein
MNAAQLLEIVTHSSWEEWMVSFTAHRLGAHPYHAAFREDVRVGLDWGAPISEKFTTVWTRRFPDEEASSHYVEATYGGTVAFQSALALVDGGRAYLPLPMPIGDSSDPASDPAVFGVWPWQVDLARLIDSLAGGTEFESYFERSRFELLNQDNQPERSEPNALDLASQLLNVWISLEPYLSVAEPNAYPSAIQMRFSPNQLELIRQWASLYKEEILEVRKIRNALMHSDRLVPRAQLIDALETAMSVRDVLERRLLGMGPAA